MNFLALIVFSTTCFALALLCAALRWALLYDSRASKLSRAAEYINVVELAGWVLCWYGISVSFTIVNRWIMVFWRGGFSYPMVITGLHMAVKLLISRIVACAQKRTPAPLGRQVYWRAAAPIGALTALDVLLANTGLVFVTVTFYTIVKTSSLIWILLWAVLMNLEALTWRMSVSVAVISLGLAIACWGETSFSAVGLILILGSGCAAGLRWALTQVLVNADSSCKDPVVVVYHIALSSALAMLPGVIIDGYRLFHGDFLTPTAGFEGFGLALLGGAVAYLLILVEVQLVNTTSSLTLGVLGQIKEVVQIAISMIAFGDKATLLNGVGLSLAVCGCWAYKRWRLQELKGKRRRADGRGYDLVIESDFETEVTPLLDDSRVRGDGEYLDLTTTKVTRRYSLENQTAH